MFTLVCQRCHRDLPVNKIPGTRSVRCVFCSHVNPLEAESFYMPKLIMIQGQEKGKEYPMGDLLTIGRDHTNGIQLKEPKVSRRHAQIICEDGQYWLEDLQSGNGSYLFDKRISKAALQDKDLIRIADAVYIFRNPYDYKAEEPDELLLPEDEAVIADTMSEFERTRAELKFDAQRSFLMSTEELMNIAEVEKANAKLRILYEVNNAISSILEIQELFKAILDVVFQYFPAERGAILLYDFESGELHPAVTKVRSGENKGPMKLSKTLMGRVVKDRVSLFTTDAMLDDSLAGAQSIITQGIRSAMSVPLISKEKLFGVLHIDTKQKVSDFNKDNLELLTGIAGQAAVAIENAKLIRKIENEVETRGHLQRYLSPELVEQIINKEFDFNIGGQLKKASILFTDLRGFTKLTEKIGAEAVVTILNDYFTRMVDIVFTNKGTLDKFIGDAIMAIWGLPIGHHFDALRAVKSAIQMEEELFFFNIFQTKAGRNRLKMGAGINTGEVVVGNMGSHKRMEYTVIGPPVNLASRTESLTTHNQILITENTYAEMEDKVYALEMPPAKLKGITRKIKIYGVVSLKDEDGIIQKFLPIVIQRDETTIEGLLQEYKEGQMLMFVEPAEYEIGSSIDFMIDIPGIAPETNIRLKCLKIEEATHGQDQFIRLLGLVEEIDSGMQDFLEPVFRVDQTQDS